MTDFQQDVRIRLSLYAFLLVTVAVYWAGLKGPFLLDDLPNFAPLRQWLAGEIGFMEAVFGNRSGMLGRPVSMLALWVSAATGGLHPFPFKLGNLLIHVLCALTAWQLLSRLLAQTPRFAAQASLVAILLASLWLLHPIQVSTVLYAVQRMAQLSTLFALLSVLTYVVAREQLVAGQVGAARLKLFLLFPLFLLLGLFSKENALVAPALCLVIELAYFWRQPRHGKTLPVFYLFFLLIPAAFALTLLLLDPLRFLSYAGRDFTLWERVLSQPRALMEYLGLLFWPRGGMMGVFVDDFAKSTALFTPMTTALSILGLLVISAIAIALRRQAPGVFAGWFFFLVGHGVESSILPLELYFEHRNYLPSFGIWLAAASLLAWLAGRIRMSADVARKSGWSLAIAASLIFAIVTWQQVQVWRTEEGIARQTLEHRPTSLRAILALTTVAVQNGRAEEGRALVQRLVESDNPRHRLLGFVHATTIDCIRGQGGDLSLLRKAEQTGVQFLTLPDAQAYTQLSRAIGYGACGPAINDASVAGSISRLVDSAAEQSDRAQAKWLLRTTAANMYISANLLPQAQKQAELAWHPGSSDAAIGALLARIHMAQGNKAAAQRTLDEVKPYVKSYERSAMEAIETLQSQIGMMEG